MVRAVVFAAVVVVLGGCASSWLPSSFDFALPSATRTAELRVESEPAGADAKTSTGANCRTPCVMNVAADREFSVTVSAEGFQPQTIAVTAIQPVAQRGEEAAGANEPRLDPNPILVQLERMPAPVKPPAKRSKKRGAPPPAKTG